MSMWSQASEIAASTPSNRNRYADFLRAISIMFVIVGHWMMMSAHYDPDSARLTPVLALEVVPWSAWLTWAFQVMPIFFIVGGYSNGISLASAQKKSLGYAEWLSGRLQRLLTPLTLLVVFWAVFAVVLNLFGVQGEHIRMLSKTALVPTWFLAIYTMIVLLAPASYFLWQRFGYWSLSVYVALAVLVDVAFFAFDAQWLGWTNYFWVWLAMHHLGFAWLDNRLASPLKMLCLSALAFVVLWCLIVYGPYPIAMAGSPGEVVSNTLPPKITLIALGVFQFGLLLALEKPMNRLLNGLRLWTCTIIVNTMSMTIYLWHMTVLIAVVAAAYFAGGIGLQVQTGTLEWWSLRPLWLLIPAAILLPVALLLSPLERISSGKQRASPVAVRLILGAVAAGLGITLATLAGFDGNLLSLQNTGVVALMLGGAWVCGVSLRRAK